MDINTQNLNISILVDLNMTKWELHRVWAVRAGIDEEISRKIDELIDFGREYKGFKIGHDWPFGGMGKFTIACEFIYEDFGSEGVKALILHGALDYMEFLVRKGYPKEEIYWRILAWIKFCNRKNVIQYIKRLPESERVEWIMSQDFSYNYIREDIRDYVLAAAKNIMEFVIRNFEDILYSIEKCSEDEKT